MTRFVPYIAEEDIERDAAALLAEYEQSRRIIIAPPIPIEVGGNDVKCPIC